MRRKLRIASEILICIIVLIGCSANETRPPFGTVGRVWPEAPDIQRIAFVGEFSRPSDLGIRESFWGRLIALTAGRRNVMMIRPMAVVASSGGNVVFVADPDAQCVHRYDIARSRYDCLVPDSKSQSISPVGLAITADGSIFVADSKEGRLFRAGPRSRKLERFETSLPLQQPTGLFWDENSALLYVVDTSAQSIHVFDQEGNLKNTFGVRGRSVGQFNFPTYIWMDTQNELLVSDSLNFRLQRFDADGNFIRAFGKNGDRPGDFSRPKGVAVDSNGHIYVVDALMHLIQVFDRQGALLVSIGELGQGDGQFWLPNGIFIGLDDTIYVTDSYNHRIQVFRYVGPKA